VRRVGATSGLPFNGLPIGTRFSIEGRPFPGEANLPVADIRIVQGDYFRAMSVRLLRGRLFDARDGEPGRRAAIINETLANQLFPAENPLGRRVQVRLGTKETDEIVGVVADVRHEALDVPVRSMIYWPNRQMGFSWMSIVVQTSVSPATLAAAVIDRIHAIDPGQPVSQVATMEQVVGESLGRRRFTMTLLALFAVLALSLAALGVYGVLATGVAQRLPELGIRLALGARPGRLVGAVVGDSAVLAAAGMAVGAVGSLALGRLIEGLLYQVRPTDLVTFGAVAALLAAVALLASWLPARRASRVDPVIALRSE
jgi:predicted permease